MSNTFTPGPWAAQNSENGIFTLHDFDGRHFANFRIVRGVETDDATLIAAAPAMLAALQDIELWARGAGLNTDQIRAAIAAATGNPTGEAEAPAPTGEGAAMFRNHYTCPKCGTDWQDEWPAACNDECPNCGLGDIEPHESEGIEP